jgi:aminoglycoside phosphotransferase (APT) family kinase protein
VPFVPDDPVLAVIAPPNMDRFRALIGIAPDAPITVDFSGWSKLVLLTDELAMLFPRDHTHAPYLTYEVEALQAIAPIGLAEAPQLVGVFDEPGVCAHEFVVERRLPGAMLDRRLHELTADDLGAVLEQVARLAARWHAADPGVLAMRPARTQPQEAFVDELLRPGGATEVNVDLTPRERATFEAALERIRALDHVLVHGDLHEGQIFVDDDLKVAGILDWQTARVNHPFTDFDLGEWGTGAWRAHRRNFPELRRRMWRAYAAERGFIYDFADDFELFWAVVHAHHWPLSVHVGSEVTGTRDEVMSTVKNAAERATPDL